MTDLPRHQQEREPNVRRVVAEYVEAFIANARQMSRRDDGGYKSYGHLLRAAEADAAKNAERFLLRGRPEEAR